MTPTPHVHTSHQKIQTTPELDGEKIVISGMSGLYPESRSVMEFSDILYNKVNSTSNDNFLQQGGPNNR